MDPDQPLSPVGRETVQRSARAMARLGIRPDVLIASEKTRSQQTAEILATALSFPKRHIRTEAAVKATVPPTQTLELLAAFAQARSILVAGHLPNLAEVAALLTGGVRGGLAFVNAGLTRLEVETFLPPKAVLLWHLPPQLLKQVGGE
jgi:phosphohistidine phosphatase